MVSASQPADGRPDQDPSPRAVEQLYREIGSLKELTFTRLDALEGAQSSFKADMVRVPTEVQKAIQALDAVLSERFKVHEQRFSGAEVVSQTRLAGIADAFLASKEAVSIAFSSSKEAVAAALTAQKEAVVEQTRSAATAIAKSEAAIAKQIDAQGAQVSSITTALSGRIDDMKDRLTKLESKADGALSERVELRASHADGRSAQGLWVAIAGLGITLVLALGGWFTAAMHPG